MLKKQFELQSFPIMALSINADVNRQFRLDDVVV